MSFCVHFLSLVLFLLELVKRESFDIFRLALALSSLAFSLCFRVPCDKKSSKLYKLLKNQSSGQRIGNAMCWYLGL